MSQRGEALGGTEPGGTFTVPRTATTDPAHATEVLGGDELIFDVQTHLLEIDTSTTEPSGGDFGAFVRGVWRGRLAQCFGIDHWFREVFVRSDTTMAVISAVPILGPDNPLSIEVMEQARRSANAVCGDDHRVLLHGQVNPNVGDVQASVDHMRALADAHPIGAWKVYTHIPGGRGWWLDDHDDDAVRCGEVFLDAVRDIGPRIVCVHKGLGGGSEYSSPVDIGPRPRPIPTSRSSCTTRVTTGRTRALPAAGRRGREPADRFARCRADPGARQRVRGARQHMVQRDA